MGGSAREVVLDIVSGFGCRNDSGGIYKLTSFTLGYSTCVGTASCSRGKLEQFINYVNNFHPALQFTWEISETSVSFLDILISINGNRLVTSVFYKPTDSHSYLLYSSSHPNHTKRSIPFSQFLRLRRLCSEDEDFMPKVWK